MSDQSPQPPEYPQYQQPQPQPQPQPPAYQQAAYAMAVQAPKRKKWPWVVGVVAALAIIGAVTGGGGGGEKEPASTSADPSTATTDSSPSEAPAFDADNMPDPEPTETDDPPVEEDPWFRVGDTLSFRSWDVKITNIDRDANREMAMANMFNDDPQGTYVLVTYDATYTGNKRMGEPEWDLTWTFSPPNGQVYDESWEVTPSDDQDWPTQARKGGTIPVQVVFDVKGPVGSSIVTVEDDREYADIKMLP